MRVFEEEKGWESEGQGLKSTTRGGLIIWITAYKPSEETEVPANWSFEKTS